MSHVGDTVRHHRLKRNLSQGDLAKHFNLSSPQFISNIERGITHLPVEMVPELSEFLDCPRKIFIDAQARDYMIECKEKIAEYRRKAMTLSKGNGK